MEHSDSLCDSGVSVACLRRVRANRREVCFAEIVGLARADPFDQTQRVERVGPQPGHLTKRGVVKDDVGWDAALASHLEPHCAEALKESAVHVLPRLRLDA